MELEMTDWREQAMNDLLEIGCIIDDLRDAASKIDEGLSLNDYNLYQEGVDLWIGKELGK